MFSKIDHIAISVRNVKISSQFYKDIFKFQDLFSTKTSSGIKIVYLQLNSHILELIEDLQGKIIGFHFCLYTPDFNQAYTYLLQKHVPLIQPAHKTPARVITEENWQRAVFLGPDGEQIEIRG